MQNSTRWGGRLTETDTAPGATQPQTLSSRPWDISPEYQTSAGAHHRDGHRAGRRPGGRHEPYGLGILQDGAVALPRGGVLRLHWAQGRGG